MPLDLRAESRVCLLACVRRVSDFRRMGWRMTAKLKA